MKRILMTILAVWLMLALFACDSLPEPSEDPTKSENPDELEQPEMPAKTVLDLIVDGKSDYTLVYDDGDAYLTACVMSFLDALQSEHGITLTAVGASEAEPDYGHEIVVGNVRPSAETVAEQLEETDDFGMCVVDDDWVLCASGSRQYIYLFAMVENRVLSKLQDGSLTVASDRDIIFQDSIYRDKTYLEYKYGRAAMTRERLAEIFEARTHKAKDGTSIAYRLYVPYDYDESREYPVLLLLHGAGERGNDNTGNLVHIVTELFNTKNTPVTDAIVIVPQCPTGRQWVNTPWANGSYDTTEVKVSNELKAVMEIMDSIEHEFSTDYNRYYVMGLSMGGFGTWDLLMRNPDYFAAGVPICGGADPNMAETLVDMPIWTFHGSADPTVPVAGTREMVDALKDAGSTVVKYEEIAGAGHGIWGGVASRKDVITWLFEQNLSQR